MACAKDATQAAIGIHLKSTLLSLCPVFCFDLFCFVCWLFLCVSFLWFLFRLLFCWLVLAWQSDCFIDYLKSTPALFCGFSCMSIQFPASKSLCNDLAKASEALDGKNKLAVNVKSSGGYEALDFVLSSLEHKFVPEWESFFLELRKGNSRRCFNSNDDQRA